MLEKTFQPAEVEKKHYDAWEKAGAFAAHPTSNKAPYTIMMPPPNVTGSLHMGHALTFTLQDILTRYQRMKGADVSRRVDEKLEQVGLAGMGHKFPAELSGGMKKRAGLARALVMEPEIILFDEPTTGLDPLMAKSIHDLIVAMQQRFKFTAVMVSHEIPEIFAISDWVAMLRKGRIALMAPTAEFIKTMDPEIHEFISVSGPVRLNQATG